MRQEDRGAAAAVIVEGQRAAANLAELHDRLRPCFRRVGPFRQAERYITGLMSDLPRKNGWTIAEHVGDATPDRTQRLINHAVWDHAAATGVIRGFVVEQLGAQPLRVAALDESGQEKQGEATAGVQRQYMGCAGRIANGVKTVYCAYATPGGPGLVGARIYVPADQLADPERRTQMGIGAEVTFRTRPELAIDILAEMLADHTAPPWCAGDEVYGRSAKLRRFCENQQIGYVLRVGCAFHLNLTPTLRWCGDTAVTRLLADPGTWEVRAVAVSKGDRAYAWAWVATTSPRHFLLIHKHLQTGDLAYHYCYVPPGRPATLATLVTVACLRWPVEEGFEFGKDHFGLDHSQVRLYTALLRHIVLAMAALAVCAVTAADARTRAPAPILPTGPHDWPPADPGLIALTVADIKRLFILATRRLLPNTHHEHWTWWRRRHQARALVPPPRPTPPTSSHNMTRSKARLPY